MKSSCCFASAETVRALPSFSSRAAPASRPLSPTLPCPQLLHTRPPCTSASAQSSAASSASAQPSTRLCPVLSLQLLPYPPSPAPSPLPSPQQPLHSLRFQTSQMQQELFALISPTLQVLFLLGRAIRLVLPPSLSIYCSFLDWPPLPIFCCCWLEGPGLLELQFFSVPGEATRLALPLSQLDGVSSWTGRPCLF